MIEILLGNIKTDEKSAKIIKELRTENSLLSKSIREVRKQYDSINTGMLLKN